MRATKVDVSIINKAVFRQGLLVVSLTNTNITARELLCTPDDVLRTSTFTYIQPI